MKRNTKIPLSHIIIDKSLQTRANKAPVDEVVIQYILVLKGEVSGTLPPVKLARIAGKLYLVDGFHRVEAHRRAAIEEVQAIIEDCDSMDAAKLLALDANQDNGMPLTNADKRARTIMAIPLLWNDSTTYREIGKRIGVSHEFARLIHNELIDAAVQKKAKAVAKKQPLSPTPPPKHTPVVKKSEVKEEGDETETYYLETDPRDKTAADMIKALLTGEVGLKEVEWIIPANDSTPELVITIRRKVWEGPK